MMNYTFAGFVFFMMLFASAWANSSEIPQTQAVMIGNVRFGQTVKFSGEARFYRKSFKVETRYFDYEDQRCQAVFQELDETSLLRLDEIQPRLRFIVGDQAILIKDLSRLKWTQTAQGYHFEGKFIVKTRSLASVPLYIQIPNSPNAKMLHLGYQGNSCGAPGDVLPTDWNLTGFDFIDQDQQEYQIQLD